MHTQYEIGQTWETRIGPCILERYNKTARAYRVKNKFLGKRWVKEKYIKANTLPHKLHLGSSVVLDMLLSDEFILTKEDIDKYPILVKDWIILLSLFLNKNSNKVHKYNTPIDLTACPGTRISIPIGWFDFKVYRDFIKRAATEQGIKRWQICGIDMTRVMFEKHYASRDDEIYDQRSSYMPITESSVIKEGYATPFLKKLYKKQWEGISNFDRPASFKQRHKVGDRIFTSYGVIEIIGYDRTGSAFEYVLPGYPCSITPPLGVDTSVDSSIPLFKEEWAFFKQSVALFMFGYLRI